MNLTRIYLTSLLLLCLISLTITQTSFSLITTIDNTTINFITNYTYTLTFPNNTTRSITLSFPPTSDISSTNLKIYQNSLATNLVQGTNFLRNNVSRTISITTPLSPFQTVMKFVITNIKNPPSAVQYQFSASVPSLTLASSNFIQFQPGILKSCIWTFSKFTGSTDSTVIIQNLISNRLISGKNRISIEFQPFDDSDNKYLTKNSTAISVQYSITDTNTGSWLNHLSGEIDVQSNYIKFNISLINNLQAGSNLYIKVNGVVNPQTQTPNGSKFKVITYDADQWQIDTISQCIITPVTLLQLTGTFQLISTLYVNTLMINPKITLNVSIPFTIFSGDLLLFQHPISLNNVTTISQIQFYRGRAIVIYSLETLNSTINSKLFKSTARQDRNFWLTSYFQFIANITAPSSQLLSTFSLTLRRNSGSYVKINAVLKANAIMIGSGKAQLIPQTTQMALQKSYILNLTLTNPISRNGKIMISFNNDFSLISGPCQSQINVLGALTQLSTTCQIITKNSLKWLVYKINGDSSIIPANSIIKITYPALIINSLYPRFYTFGIQVYYFDLEAALVEYSTNFANISMTTHYPARSTLLQNDFTVFETRSITIKYINQVVIPSNSIIKMNFPSEIYDFKFSNNTISINGTNLTINTFVENTNTKTLTLTVNKGSQVLQQSIWLISVNITMPLIVANYPSIVFSVYNLSNSAALQQTNQGLQIRLKNPFPDISSTILPKSNRLIDANSSYQLVLKSSVPLMKKFDIELTLPTDIQFPPSLSTANLSCLSVTNATCLLIQQSGLNKITISLENSTYSSLNTYQQFTLVFQTLTNRRSSAASGDWTIQTKANYTYKGITTLGSITKRITKSNNFQSSTNLVCSLDKSYDYYRNNTENVIINCVFHNALLSGDFIIIQFTTDSYNLNGNLSCPTPLFIQCSVNSSSATILSIKVLITSSPSFNSNKLRLQIAGLISNANTEYSALPIQIKANRYDSSSAPIDQGFFNYTISCTKYPIKKCKTCNPTNGSCILCYDGMFKLDNDSCVSSCPSETQFRTINNANSSTCEYCAFPCYNCTSLTTCLTCSNTSYYLLTTNYSCVLTCDITNGFWVNTLDSLQRKCDTCLQNCLQCKNRTFTGCIRCVSGYILDKGYCSKTCSNTSSYVFNSQCQSCDISCATCTTGGSNGCTLCASNYYNNSGYCVKNCPSNKYPLPNNTCGCVGDCLTCTSSSPTFCGSCQNTSNFIYNGTCLTQCPSQYYLQINTCVPCPSNCLVCQSGKTCTTCLPTFYYYQSLCYYDCNSISYQFDIKPNSSYQCVLCPTGCDTCSDLICTSCLKEYTFINSTCVLTCQLTDSCPINTIIPQKILPLPGSLSIFGWIIIVIVAKYFVTKLYTPYSVVFVSALIEYVVILVSIIYCNDLINQNSLKRLLITKFVDYSYRQTIFSLLIVSIAFNYLSNIVFGWIFIKYIKPLITVPKQIDYITISFVWIFGLLANYRFCLIFFSKMFPKPHIHIDYASRLTPIHYLCVSSIVFGIFTLSAGGLMVKNQDLLTDSFMLGIDLIIIQLLLIGFSVWMISIDKSKQYYQDQTKKQYAEQIHHNTEQAQKDQKNQSKHNLMRDEFQDHHKIQSQVDVKCNNNLEDSINFDKKLQETMHMSLVNNKDNEKPDKPLINKNAKGVLINLEKGNGKSNRDQTRDQNDMSNLSGYVNKGKIKNHRSPRDQQGDVVLKNKFKQLAQDSNKKLNQSSNSKLIFERSDDQIQNNILPETLKKNQSQININEPQSDQIPNLPLNDSVFHQRSSSQFGLKVKTNKLGSKLDDKSQGALKPNKSPIKEQNRLHRSTNPNKNMKKKNKFFESQGFDSQLNENVSQKQKNKNTNDLNEKDIDNIIQSKIIIIRNSKQNQEQDLKKTFSNHNISGIQIKSDENNSQMNEQISPSWFNIQNQRFDFQDQENLEQ